MWIVPSKNFSPWRSPLKSGSLDSRPVQLASIQVDNHEKSNKYVIVPSKNFSPWRSPLKTQGLDSRPATRTLFKLIITKKSTRVCDRPLKKIFLRDARLSKNGSLDSRPVTLASIQVDNHEKIK